jgi:regulator of replication initiation timing
VDNLEEQQSAMRKRMKDLPKSNMAKKPAPVVSRKRLAANQQSPEVTKLKSQIATLQAENASLRAENERLRRQKTVYVEREKSGDDLRREQQHNYFKYSNARRW